MEAIGLYYMALLWNSSYSLICVEYGMLLFIHISFCGNEISIKYKDNIFRLRLILLKILMSIKHGQAGLYFSFVVQ